MSQFTAQHDQPIQLWPAETTPAPAPSLDRIPLTTRTLHGVVMTVSMIRALREVVVNDTRYDLATMLNARSATALFRRNLVRYTGHGEQVLPTSRGVWMLYDLVGIEVPANVVQLFIEPDRDDAIREWAHRMGVSSRVARTMLDRTSDGDRVSRPTR